LRKTELWSIFKSPMSLFKKRIYADWAATTPIHWSVLRAMRKVGQTWANPSAIHKEGVAAKRVLESARASVARDLSVRPDEVFFTSGGTEANATIIQGVLRMHLEKGVKPADVHVVSTAIEHSSVIETLRLFEKHGVKVSYVAPGADGVMRADDVLKAITPQTVLVSCMYANNEIGTIQPVSKIGAGIRKVRAAKGGDTSGADGTFPIFHVDASQAPLWLACDPEGLRADAVTIDGHKMQGPKGVGALIVRNHLAFLPLMAGGGQEKGKRPTTESVVLATGLSAALSMAKKGRDARSLCAKKMQTLFFSLLEKELPQAIINGHKENRLPNNINISLPNLNDPEFAVLKLDAKGIACSTKSSCLKGEEESYVVRTTMQADPQAVNTPWRAKNTLRFTFAPNTPRRHIKRILRALKGL
jgi:cysteine desulfurase